MGLLQPPCPAGTSLAGGLSMLRILLILHLLSWSSSVPMTLRPSLCALTFLHSPQPFIRSPQHLSAPLVPFIDAQKLFLTLLCLSALSTLLLQDSGKAWHLLCPPPPGAPGHLCFSLCLPTSPVTFKFFSRNEGGGITKPLPPCHTPATHHTAAYASLPE